MDREEERCQLEYEDDDPFGIWGSNSEDGRDDLYEIEQYGNTIKTEPRSTWWWIGGVRCDALPLTLELRQRAASLVYSSQRSCSAVSIYVSSQRAYRPSCCLPSFSSGSSVVVRKGCAAELCTHAHAPPAAEMRLGAWVYELARGSGWVEARSSIQDEERVLENMSYHARNASFLALPEERHVGRGVKLVMSSSEGPNPLPPALATSGKDCEDNDDDAKSTKSVIDLCTDEEEDEEEARSSDGRWKEKAMRELQSTVGGAVRLFTASLEFHHAKEVAEVQRTLKVTRRDLQGLQSRVAHPVSHSSPAPTTSVLGKRQGSQDVLSDDERESSVYDAIVAELLCTLTGRCKKNRNSMAPVANFPYSDPWSAFVAAVPAWQESHN
ncbi:hypothetical protein FB107DRAFT_252738 [Schizophyllum commune]